MSPIDTGIIVAYLAMMVGIGLYANRQQDNIEDYFVASGRVGTISIACLWLAGWVGGAAIVAGSSNAYAYGISAGWYHASQALGCFLFGLFLAARVNRIGHRNGEDLQVRSIAGSTARASFNRGSSSRVPIPLRHVSDSSSR